VRIQNESQTLASITFQNYFRLYKKLAGMTGTADTEAFEFQHIYSLETVLIPTHQPMVRADAHDKVYRTHKEKHDAIVADVKDCYARGQPVLLGTTSIENSEVLSKLLEGEKLPHQVLNAKQHEREATIVAQAGRPKMITIATNMAGRGTDIVLGGNPEPELKLLREDEKLSEADKTARIAKVKHEWQERHNAVVQAGGLHIVGSERHESRRIDNQLRGRSGRQGDPGSSRFYLSLEDPLLKIFASDRVSRIMAFLKMPEGEAIEHNMVTRAIENAQRKVEARNFDIRKQLLEYDDVANDQRKVIYQQRNELLEASDISDTIKSMRTDVVRATCDQFIPPESVEEQWDAAGLERALEGEFNLKLPVSEWLKEQKDLHEEAIKERVVEAAHREYEEKFVMIDKDALHQYERAVMLHSLDRHWREHLAALDYLRQGIHLRGYAQKNPKQEYKREAFELFGGLLDVVKREVTGILTKVQVRTEQAIEQAAEAEAPQPHNVQYHHADYDEALAVAAADDAPVQPIRRGGEKVGRNDPCPCGSGKKYKQCHGRLA
jgi:preprotein translocase subunit SecA